MIKYRTWNGKEMSEPITYTNSEGYKYLKSSGLYDINGQEIYEGDIIKPLYARYSKNCVIKYGEFWGRDFYAVPEISFYICGEDFGIDSLLGYLELVEVIGNIYENPELLDGGK